MCFGHESCVMWALRVLSSSVRTAEALLGFTMPLQMYLGWKCYFDEW